MRQIFICSLKLIVILCVLAAALSGAVFAQGKSIADVQFAAERGENLTESIMKGDWSGAKTYLQDLIAKENALGAAMRDMHMPPSSYDQFTYLLFRLKYLIPEKNRVVAALAANQLTDILADLEQRYKPKVPAELARMDYLGRDIVILSQAQDDYGLIKVRINSLENTWSKIKGDVNRRGGKDISAQFDAALGNLRTQTNRAQIVGQANHILDLVDKVEGLYKK